MLNILEDIFNDLTNCFLSFVFNSKRCNQILYAGHTQKSAMFVTELNSYFGVNKLAKLWVLLNLC